MALGRDRKATTSVYVPTSYEAKGATLEAFLMSEGFPVEIILGPQGSGKSVAAWMKIRRLMYEQAPDPDGIRRTKWIIVRNTYPELELTTLKTYRMWFPEEVWGPIRMTKPMTHVLRDGDMESEIVFLALDSEEDIKKLMSLEYTGAYCNEIRYMDLNLFSEIKTRSGRFPQKDLKKGFPGASWHGVIADTNMPEAYHWLLLMFGITPLPDWLDKERRGALRRPEGWVLYRQPPGLLEFENDRGEIEYRENPAAENQEHLKQSYLEVIQGKTRSWINANILLRPSPDQQGMPIHPMFSRSAHVAREPLRWSEHAPVSVGLDFGRMPALVAGQFISGRWYVLFELVGENMGATTFAPIARRELVRRFPNAVFRIWGDPSGDYRGEQGEETAFGIFRNNGLMVQVPPNGGGNRFSVRKEAVETVLNRQVDGRSGMLIDPTCYMLIGGFEGGYHYKRLKTSGGVAYAAEPDKSNAYSHPQDALQYMLLGEGEGTLLLGGDLPRAVRQTRQADVLKMGNFRGVMRR
jgi:hypothetical protein